MKISLNSRKNLLIKAAAAEVFCGAVPGVTPRANLQLAYSLKQAELLALSALLDEEGDILSFVEKCLRQPEFRARISKVRRLQSRKWLAFVENMKDRQSDDQPRSITQIFDFVVSKALAIKSVVEENIGKTLIYPTFKIDVQFVDHSVTESKFDFASVAATSDVQRILGVSCITLLLKEDAFDRTCLMTLLYVFAHEILIHGVQNIDGGTRYNADDSCAWSEGFMDHVIFMQVAEWLSKREPHLPACLRDARREAFGACLAMHESRYSLPPRDYNPPALLRRIFARHAAEELNLLFQGAEWISSISNENLLTFAHKLNMHSFNKDQRKELIFHLALLLHPETKEKQEDIYQRAGALCLDFSNEMKIRNFVGEIEELNDQLGKRSRRN
jgi:hypothetical protein